MTEEKKHGETQRKLKRLEKNQEIIYELLKEIRRKLQNLEEKTDDES